MKKDCCGTMTHDYKRHGTTTLFAALNVLEGKIIGRCMQRHRHQEFIRFLNTIEADIPNGKIIHVVLDNERPFAANRISFARRQIAAVGGPLRRTRTNSARVSPCASAGPH
jgi:hypothetical protein